MPLLGFPSNLFTNDYKNYCPLPDCRVTASQEEMIVHTRVYRNVWNPHCLQYVRQLMVVATFASLGFMFVLCHSGDDIYDALPLWEQ